MGWGLAIQAVIAAGLYLYNVEQAEKAAKKALGTPLIDDKPPALSSKGVLIPVTYGTNMVGPFIAWVGNRTVLIEYTSSGGKGYSGTPVRQITYFEDAWHVLACNGPRAAGETAFLGKIRANGEVIFDGGINSNETPSGSTIVTERGSLQVYWGKDGDPRNNEINTAIGINSTWPGFLYVYWVQFRLGGFAQWSGIEYETEIGPSQESALDLPSSVGTTKGGIGPTGDKALLYRVINADSYVPQDNVGGQIKIYGDAMFMFEGDSIFDDVYVVLPTQPYFQARNTVFKIKNKFYDPDEDVWLPMFNNINGDDSVSPTRIYNYAEAWYVLVSGLSANAVGFFTAYADEWHLRTGVTYVPETADQSFPDNALVTNLTEGPYDYFNSPFHFHGNPPVIRELTQAQSPYTTDAYCRLNPEDLEDFPASDEFSPYGVEFILCVKFGVPAQEDIGFAQHIVVAMNEETSANSSAKHYVKFTASGLGGGVSIDPVGGAYAYKHVYLGDYWHLIHVRYITDTGRNNPGSGEHEFPQRHALIRPSLDWEKDTKVYLTEMIAYNTKFAQNYTDPGSSQGQSIFGDLLKLWVDPYDAIDGTGVTTLVIDAETPLVRGISQPARLMPRDAHDAGWHAHVYKSGYGGNGVNPVHLLHTLMFSERPRGANLRKDLFDIVSLDAIGVLLASAGESLAMSVVINQRSTWRSAVAKVMQDAGILISWDMTQGKYKFVLLRENAEVNNIPKEAILGPLPEIDHLLEIMNPTRITFAFKNALLNYREDVVEVNNDGAEAQRVARVDDTASIPTARDKATASKIAIRRAQEGLAPYKSALYYTNRATRHLVPGELVSFETKPIERRIKAKTIDIDSRKVELDTLVDNYSVPEIIDAEAVMIAPPSGLTVPQDLASLVIELPLHLADNQVTLAVLRARGNATVPMASLHVSTDDLTYELIGSCDNYVSIASAKEPWGPRQTFVEEGPYIAITGIDRPPTSTSEHAWKSGSQIMWFNGEWCYYREIVAGPKGGYQVKGVARARFGSPFSKPLRQGSAIFFFNLASLETYTHPLFAPGSLLYFKIQPKKRKAIPIEQIFSSTTTIVGKAFTPLISNLRTDIGVDAFVTGEDVEFSWAYTRPDARKKRLGADYMGAGEAATGDSTFRGTFLLKILDGETEVRSQRITDDHRYTYTNANIISDLSSERDFTVTVVHIVDGYFSEVLTKEIEFIS